MRIYEKAVIPLQTVAAIPVQKKTCNSRAVLSSIKVVAPSKSKAAAIPVQKKTCNSRAVLSSIKVVAPSKSKAAAIPTAVFNGFNVAAMA